MKIVPTAVQTALNARRLVARDFLWIIARVRDTNEPVAVGFWSGLTNIAAASVIDPHTGAASSRAWYGAGGLIQIPDIPATVGYSVSSLDITMSQLDEMVAQAVRGYDVKQAEVQIFRGLYDPDTNVMVAPATCRFFGYVDNVKITTPSENEDGSVVLTCANQTQELLRANPTTRSHADQQLRAPGDDFFIDADTVGQWGPMQWGPEQTSVKSQPTKQGLFGWGNFLGFL